jgi:hypothetical protein
MRFKASMDGRVATSQLGGNEGELYRRILVVYEFDILR